jgi:hypothetical protein
MTEIINKLNNYSTLTYFNLIDSYFEFDDNTIDKIWSLSKLKHFYISPISYQKKRYLLIYQYILQQSNRYQLERFL